MQNYFGSRRDFIDLDDWVNFHDSLTEINQNNPNFYPIHETMTKWMNIAQIPPFPNKVFILFHQKVIKIQWVIQKNFLWSSPISKTSATDIVIVMQISVRTSRLSWCYLLSSPITGSISFESESIYLFTMTISTVLGFETNTEQSGWWEFLESFSRFSDNFEVNMCSTKQS